MREYVTQNTEPRAVRGDWGVWYRYTHGVAGERFFRELKDHKRLVASKCPKCQRSFLPPNLYCEDCFVEMTEYHPVAGSGTVESFTVLHESLDETPLAQPIVAVLVRFEGTAGGLLAPLKGVRPDQVKIGMKVKPEFEAKAPTHSIRDLAFVPA